MDHNLKDFIKGDTRFRDLGGQGQGQKGQSVSFYKISVFIVFLNVLSENIVNCCIQLILKTQEAFENQ